MIEDELLIERKARFLDAVRRAAECIGFLPPYVNFDGCDFERNTLAHIHTESNKICISEIYLRRATFDQLQDTAIHEVTHLLDASHHPSFYKAQARLRLSLWRPPVNTRRHLSENELRELSKFMEADIRKWHTIHIDENGEEYFLKTRRGLKKYLKDELPYYSKPSHNNDGIYRPLIEKNQHQVGDVPSSHICAFCKKGRTSYFLLRLL